MKVHSRSKSMRHRPKSPSYSKQQMNITYGMIYCNNTCNLGWCASTYQSEHIELYALLSKRHNSIFPSANHLSDLGRSHCILLFPNLIYRPACFNSFFFIHALSKMLPFRSALVGRVYRRAVLKYRRIYVFAISALAAFTADNSSL